MNYCRKCNLLLPNNLQQDACPNCCPKYPNNQIPYSVVSGDIVVSPIGATPSFDYGSSLFDFLAIYHSLHMPLWFNNIKLDSVERSPGNSGYIFRFSRTSNENPNQNYRVEICVSENDLNHQENPRSFRDLCKEAELILEQYVVPDRYVFRSYDLS